jgi:hypothetical protein
MKTAAVIAILMGFVVFASAGEADGEKTLKLILDAKTDDALVRITNDVRFKMKEKAIKRLLVALANNVESKERLQFESKDPKSTYPRDLKVAGERCLYAIEVILGHDLPVKNLSRTKVLEELVQALTYDLDIGERGDDEAIALAKDKNTSRFMLERLAGHPNWQVRLALFSNPSVPRYIIRRLSDDTEPHIRAASIKRMEEDLKKGIR